jgi:uncharacterized protein VirK/YbjX
MKTFKLLSKLIIIRPDALLVEAALTLAGKLSQEAIDGIIAGTHSVYKSRPRGYKRPRKVEEPPHLTQVFYTEPGE